MKDKIANILKDYTKKNGISASFVILEDYAEELIKNGVIVPPCKVGDIVYMITPNGDIRNLTISSICIELKNKEKKNICLAVFDYEGKPCYIQIQSFKFGKTVFLTKEEAEKHLKGGVQK